MQQIRIDFDNPGLPQSLGAVEGESQSRIFQAALYKSGAAYTAPAGAVYSIMYRGFGPQNQGWFDTIEDGAGKRAACTVSGNVVTCELARQALRVPGHLTVVLCVTDAKGYMLKSWPIMADVRNDGYEDTVEVESFFYITQITSAEWAKAFAAWEDFKAMIDPTLTLSGKAADAKATGAAVDKLEDKKADKTDLDTERKRIDVLNEGGLNLKDEVIDTSIRAWLADHPEATTTVQNGAITEQKINAEFLNYIKKDYVTPEMFGAVGDGVADDTESFNKCINHSSLILLGAGKKYNVKKLTYNANYIICGFGAHNEYVQTNTMPTIKNLSITGSVEWNDKAQCFENVQLENCALSDLNRLILKNCYIRKSSIINLRGGRVESSYFEDCEEAISGIVDSIVSNTTFTSCTGFCIKGGSSSTIIGNRFQWSKVGLDLHFSHDLLVTSNWFDRNENGIVLQENTEVSIVDNVFKRSIYSHIKGKINNCIINNNKFIYANINESDSEEIKIGPAAVFEITGFDRSTLVGNQILKKTNDVKLFIEAVGARTDNNAIYGNIVDNVPLESKTKRITFTAAQKNIFQMSNIIDKGSYASAIEFSIFYQGNFFAVPEVTFESDGIHVNAPSLKVGTEYMLNTRIIYRDISVL